MSATFAARSVHSGERASSPGHPIGRCGGVLVSGIGGQPSATRIRALWPATYYCERPMPPTAALSRRAQRGGDSIRPGPAGQTCSRSPPRPRPSSSQPGPSPALMFRTCLRLRLRVACSRRGFDCAYVEARIIAELPIRAVRRRDRLRRSAASHRRCDLKLTACATCCGWRMLSTAARSRRVLRGGDSI